jgi:hypothetical protein
MARLSRHTFFAFSTFCAAALVVLSGACKKDPPPPPIDLTPPPAVDAGVVQLVPLDDAGDAAPEVAPPKGHGGGGAPTNANAARIRQCCNAIRHEAAKLGAAPEAAMMIAAAAQCDVVASQVAGGSAPEFGQVRTLLKGHTLPAACSGM